MSTTFEVYPSSKVIPSFLEVLYLTEQEVNKYLRSMNIDKDIRLSAGLQSIKTHAGKPVALTDKMIWDESMYAWFYMDKLPGGTDTYFYQHDDLVIECLTEELAVNPDFKKFRYIFEKNIELGYRWVFRRSAGQPAVITLCYGFLAAALAMFTDGVVYTDDGAWDYKRFPADPNDFVQ